jgi:hypothetical protein
MRECIVYLDEASSIIAQLQGLYTLQMGVNDSLDRIKIYYYLERG